jgi:hypothetical protein
MCVDIQERSASNRQEADTRKRHRGGAENAEFYGYFSAVSASRRRIGVLCNVHYVVDQRNSSKNLCDLHDLAV